jgi:predicted RNA binding protein YcfA (HicA-like mRNA interferase family)
LTPCTSARKAISIIASRLLEDLKVGGGAANPLKQHTIAQINSLMTWLCYRGCEIGHSDRDEHYGQKYCSVIERCIALWENSKHELQLTRLIKTECPKIDKIIEMLRHVGDEIADELGAIRRSTTPAFANMSVGDPFRHIGEEQRCPWYQTVGADLAAIQADPRPDQAVLRLLSTLLFSLEAMSNDPEAKQKISGWAAIDQFISGIIQDLRSLEKEMTRKGDVVPFIPEISNLIRRLSERTRVVPAASMCVNPDGRQAVAISFASPFAAAGRDYGWLPIVEVLKELLDRMQIGSPQPVEPPQFSEAFIRELCKVLSDLTDWADVLLTDDPAAVDSDSVTVSLQQVRSTALLFLVDMLRVLRDFRSFVETSIRDQTGASRETLKEFEHFQQQLLNNMQLALSILEAPIISYANASELIPSAVVRDRRSAIQQSRKCKPVGMFPSTGVGEIPESQRKEFNDWTETFCIPLRGMIEAFSNLPQAIEAEKEYSAPHVEAVRKSAQHKHKKHKKKADQGSAPQVQITPDLAPLEPEKSSSISTQDDDPGRSEPGCLPSFSEEAGEAALDAPSPSDPEIQADYHTVQEEEAAAAACQSEKQDSESAAPPAYTLPEADSAPAEIAVAGRIKRKDRDVPLRVNTFRKLSRLLREYGFKQESGGKHLMFVDRTRGKITVPFHGGKGSIAKGTSRAIVERAKELAARLDKYMSTQ